MSADSHAAGVSEPEVHMRASGRNGSHDGYDLEALVVGFISLRRSRSAFASRRVHAFKDPTQVAMYAALMLLSVQYFFSAPNSSSPGCSRSACMAAMACRSFSTAVRMENMKQMAASVA